MNTSRKILLLAAVLAPIFKASAQQTGVKTNLLYWATTTPNIGLEVQTGRRHTAQLFYGFNPWSSSSGKKMRVGMDIVLDSLPMTANRRIVLTPVLHSLGDSIMLKPVVVNSRRQQIVYDWSDHRHCDGATPVVVQHSTGQ